MAQDRKLTTGELVSPMDHVNDMMKPIDEQLDPSFFKATNFLPKPSKITANLPFLPSQLLFHLPLPNKQKNFFLPTIFLVLGFFFSLDISKQ